MAHLPAWRRYARFFGVDVARDVDEELTFHLDEKIADLVARGMTPRQARAEALRQFGSVADVKRLCRAWGHTRERRVERRFYWSGWGQDLRYALRTLRKSPVVTAVAVLSIALGIGANTAIFTLLDQVLLRKLPVANADSLVRISTDGYYYGSSVGNGRQLSHQHYLELRQHGELFAGMFAAYPVSLAVNGGDRAEMVQTELITGTYLSTLGVGAIRGRVIGPEEDRVPGGHPVAVISYGYWQRRFGGDPSIVGRTLSVANEPMTVIGVLEPGFDGLDLASATQLFVPLAMEARVMPTAERLSNRGLRWLNIFARLAPGVTAAQATTRLEPAHKTWLDADVRDVRFARAAANVKERYLSENRVTVTPSPGGHTPVRGSLERPLLLLMAIVCGVLLIACANVANLLLARGAARQREIALRLSLGATRARIIRQLLIESLLLALVGAAAGLLLATAGARLLIQFFVDQDSVNLIQASPDWRILAFTGIVALLTGLLFGCAPAFQSTRPALAPTLKDQAGSVAGGAHVRLRKALVISQVALSLLLLIGAGLFIRSLHQLMTVDLGFRTERMLMFGADPTIVGRKDLRAKQYAMDLLARVRATPGVTAAGFTRVPLLWGGTWGGSVTLEGYRAKANEEIGSRLNAVGPGYFESVGIPLLMGRDFTEGDMRPVPPAPNDADDPGYRTAIVSESFVKRYIDGNPIGRRIGLGSDPGTTTPIEIIGVVKDSVYSDADERRGWQIFFAFLESPDPGTAWYYVRTARDPEDMLQEMRRAMQAIDPNVPPLSLRTVETQLARSLVNQRLVTGLSTVFGLLATLLAMVGLYGVMAHSVARRTREIGIRMALGAQATRAAWLVLREAFVLIAVGVGLALPAMWWLSRYLQSELYGVAPMDPLTIGAAVLMLSLVAAAAGFVPARRAARIDPIRALRHE